jgi:hypothetical protein
MNTPESGDDSVLDLLYRTGGDLAQSTSYQRLGDDYWV